MLHFIHIPFIEKYNFIERHLEANRIMARFTDRLPIICEKNQKDIGTPDIDKHKYLVPYNITIGQFMYVIRRRIQLPSGVALFLFIGDNKTILPTHTLMEQVYNQFKNKDGFLYIMYSRENVFG